MATLISYDTISGVVYNADYDTYANIHDAAIGIAIQNQEIPDVETVNLPGGYYSIDRAVLKFDLSALPADAIISSAVISLYGRGKTVVDEFDIVVVSGIDLVDPLVASDYGDLLDETTSYGNITSTAWAENAFNNISLNATGIAAISNGAVNYFAIRTSLDINNTAPTGVNEALWQGYGYGNDAYITVTYTSFIPKIFYF